MKILILAYSFDKIGGIEQVARDIYSAIKDNNDVNTVSIIDKKRNKYKNIFINRIYNKFFLKYILRWKIKNYNSDLIISLHPFLLDFLLEKELSKTICWAHGIDVWGKNGFLVKNNLQLVRSIIAVSSFTKKRIIYDLEINRKKIKVLNNCVNINEFQYKPLNKNLPFRLLTVGRLDAAEQYKGHDLVIKALALLKKKNLNIIYNIVGDGTDRKRLEKLAKYLKVDKQVNFLGKVSFDEIKQAYHNCHLFIMPSFYSIKPDGDATGEGFGIVYLEAGASGRAVIGCDVGGQTDCIRDGINGLLVKPDEKDIAQKIESLYGKFDLLEEMGRNGRKIVEEEFSMKRFERDLKKFLREIGDVR